MQTPHQKALVLIIIVKTKALSNKAEAKNFILKAKTKVNWPNTAVLLRSIA